MVNYLKILRWPNLLIILFTQGLFRFCIIEPFFALGEASPALSYFEFSLLVLSTMLIAAGGYVINDIVDLNADKVNKPDKLIAGKKIPVSHLKIYYWSLSTLGVLIGTFLSFRVDNYQLAFIFLIVAIMLWYYSKRYQKTLLSGNIIISLMSALVVGIIWIFELFALMAEPVKYVEAMAQLTTIGWIALAYAVFAFLISLIREILKDVEDQGGDKQQNYKTLVILKGIKVTKITVIVIQTITTVLLGISQYLLFHQNLTLVFWYLLITVQVLMLYFIFNTLSAKTKEEFRFLSNVAKMIMVAGILSMQLFYISL